MKMVNAQTGALEDVPEEQVQQAYLGRSHNFTSPDERVPVKKADGSLVTVPASQAHVAFARGATIPSHEELAQAKYGGVGGQAIAGVEGAIRGATMSGSDIAATEIAGLVGGDSAKEAVREHLAGEKEANPITSATAEIGGAAIPALMTGGATAPESLAEESVANAGRIAKLARVLGAPARAVSGAGEVAGGLAEAVTGEAGAGNALARIAKVAAKAGATGAAEGGLFGAANQIDEDVLGDHQVTAEKLVSAVGHGMLYGGMFGTGLGAAGGALREGAAGILNRVAPSMEKGADLAAYKQLGAKLNVTKEVIARAGGEAEVGATARKFSLFGDTMMDAATSNPEKVLERTQAAKAQVFQQIDQKLAQAGEAGASEKASVILGKLKQQIDDLESTTAGSLKAGPLRQFHDEMAAKLGVTSEEVPRTGVEVREWMKANPDRINGKYEEEFPREAFYRTVVHDPDVPLAKMVEERRALGKLFGAYKQNPPIHVEELQRFYGHMSELEENAMNRAADSVGGQPGTELKALNKDYQRLSLIEKATREKVATMGTNRTFSLTAKMFAAAHAAGALAHGNIPAAAGAVGTAYATKFAQENGAAMTSMALGKLAKLDLLARASQQVDDRLDAAFTKFAEKPAAAEGARGAKIRLRHFSGASGDTPQDRYDKARSEVPSHPAPNVRLAHVDQAIPELSTHAPKTALATAQTVATGAKYLADAQPKAPGMPSIAGKPARPSQAAMASYARKARAVDDPIGTIERGLETNKIHLDEIQTIQLTKPALYEKSIRQPALELYAQHGKTMPFDKVLTLSKVAQTPLVPALTLPGFTFLQGTFVPTPQNPNPSAPAKAPKRMIQGLDAMTTLKAGSP